MNSQNLGELASDRKIDKVFHVYGYSIPVAKDGRRLWPTRFKREMGQRMSSGTLSVGEVQKTCRVSDSTAYKWKKKHGRVAVSVPKQTKNLSPNFAEVKVESPSDNSADSVPQVVFKRAGCELLLPSDYPVDRLVQLISAFESRS